MWHRTTFCGFSQTFLFYRFPTCLVLCFLIGVLFSAWAAESADPAEVASALADLRRAYQQLDGTSVNTADLIAINDAFFARVNFEKLTLDNLAALVQLNAFAHGEKAQSRARDAAQRLEGAVDTATVDGALAAALRVELARRTREEGPERQKRGQQYLHHPALVSLLQSKYGALAMRTTLSSVSSDQDRAFVLDLVGKLDPSTFVTIAPAVDAIWQKIESWVPEGERREQLRGHLVDGLSAAIAQSQTTPELSAQRPSLERELAILKGAAASGQLFGKTAPEIHFDWTSQQNWRSLSDLRGKVVVLDFWATWCAPCVASFPHVAKLVEHYHGSDVVIVGVTSLQGTIANLRGSSSIDCRGEPEKEKQLTREFIQEHGMTWPIVFSREPLLNPDYGIKGIPSVIIIAPDGTVRHVSTGFSEAEAIDRIDALLKEFHLRLVPSE